MEPAGGFGFVARPHLTNAEGDKGAIEFFAVAPQTLIIPLQLARALASDTHRSEGRMGAWGADSFANDDAMDWLTELEEARDLNVIRDALAAVDNEAGYIEAPTCSIAICAAEVLAAMRGRPCAKMPEEVALWIAAHSTMPDVELTALASRVVNTIRSDNDRSELLQLWSEAATDDRDAWASATSDLQTRLSA